MQQPLNLTTNDKASECATACPTCLGNPASMLPFLTAQASSVLSMASGNQGAFSSAGGGGILTPSTHDLTCGSENDTEQSTTAPVGLDLGNGWKVVGLTSLAAPPLPSSASVQLPQSVAANSSSSEFGNRDPSSLIRTTLSSEPACLTKSGCLMSTPPILSSSVPSLNESGCVMKTPPILSSSIPGEWKVVGLTSLNQGNSDISCGSKVAAVPVQNLTLPDSMPLSSSADVNLSDSRVKQNEQYKQSHLANNLGNNLTLPSLADVAAGTSDWKIAGVTTLISPVEASAACESNKAQSISASTATPTAPPAIAPEVSLTDTSEWKVVGVTSLNSPPTNSAPVVASSDTTPSSLVMASTPPMVTIPLSPSTGNDMVWKVVGMVPLPQQTETQSKDAASQVLDDNHQDCNISDSLVQKQSKSQKFDEEDQLPVDTKSSDEECVPKPWMSSRLPDSRKWTSRCLDRREDPNHPLSFLKNCSNQFRNAVLKRNTVSTMLELKRAYQDLDKKEKLLNYTEGRNHLSLSKNLMYFALKRLSKSAKSKFVDDVDDDELLEQNSDGLDISRARQSTRKKQDNLRLGEADQDSVSEDEAFCTAHHKSAKHQMVNQSSPSSVTDDREALSMAYRSQIESEMKTHFSSAPPLPHCPDPEHEDSIVPFEKHQTFSDIPLKTMIKNEDGPPVMNLRHFDSDAVNLTSVDPWGVCTSESLGEIPEMSDKEESKTHQSSSRKRKLSTPRKMIQ